MWATLIIVGLLGSLFGLCILAAVMIWGEDLEDDDDA